MNRHRKTAFSILLVLIMMLGMTPVPASCTDEESALLRFHQINVGCACANLITVNDTVILVDCGTDTDAGLNNQPLLDYLSAVGINHIDCWFLTHYHNDHAINLNTLLELYGTDTTVVFGPSAVLPDRFLPLAAGHYLQFAENEQYSCAGIVFTCLGPESRDVTGELNKDSLNIRMDYGDTSFMITGDCVADNLIVRHPDEIRDIDVLCFPHHGLTPYKVSTYILSAMNSSLVLVASNAAGNIRVYCKNCGLNATVLCSGKAGNIVVTSDGHGLSVSEQADPADFAVQ